MREVRVWDLPTRLFHWTLVSLICFSWFSGEQGGSWLKWHFWSGYAVLALVLFRIGWGFVGSTTARFASFLKGPGAAIAHFRHVLRQEPDREFGHNAAGGWVVVALLLVLLVQTVTGLFADDDIATTGPLAGLVGYDLSQQLTTIHKINFNLLLGLAGAHVLAVIVYLVYAGINLVHPMVAGHKTVPADTRVPPLVFAAPGRALVLLAVAAALVWGIVSLGR